MVADFGQCSHRELASAANRVPLPRHDLSGRVVRSDRRLESRERQTSGVLRVQRDQGNVNERRV